MNTSPVVCHYFTLALCKHMHRKNQVMRMKIIEVLSRDVSFKNFRFVFVDVDCFLITNSR
jgi:hypothetical protein